MIIDGRTIATIIIYIFTFLGFMIIGNNEKEQEREHLLEKIRIIKDFEKWIKEKE